MEHCGLAYERDTHLFGMDVAYYALNRIDYEKTKADLHEPVE
jgi:hypothetical protein